MSSCHRGRHFGKGQQGSAYWANQSRQTNPNPMNSRGRGWAGADTRPGGNQAGVAGPPSAAQPTYVPGISGVGRKLRTTKHLEHWNSHVARVRKHLGPHCSLKEALQHAKHSYKRSGRGGRPGQSNQQSIYNQSKTPIPPVEEDDDDEEESGRGYGAPTLGTPNPNYGKMAGASKYKGGLPSGIRDPKGWLDQHPEWKPYYPEYAGSGMQPARDSKFYEPQNVIKPVRRLLDTSSSSTSGTGIGNMFSDVGEPTDPNPQPMFSADYTRDPVRLKAKADAINRWRQQENTPAGQAARQAYNQQGKDRYKKNWLANGGNEASYNAYINKGYRPDQMQPQMMDGANPGTYAPGFF